MAILLLPLHSLLVTPPALPYCVKWLECARAKGVALGGAHTLLKSLLEFPGLYHSIPQLALSPPRQSIAVSLSKMPAPNHKPVIAILHQHMQVCSGCFAILNLDSRVRHSFYLHRKFLVSFGQGSSNPVKTDSSLVAPLCVRLSVCLKRDGEAGESEIEEQTERPRQREAREGKR